MTPVAEKMDYLKNQGLCKESLFSCVNHNVMVNYMFSMCYGKHHRL